MTYKSFDGPEESQPSAEAVEAAQVIHGPGKEQQVFVSAQVIDRRIAAAVEKERKVAGLLAAWVNWTLFNKAFFGRISTDDRAAMERALTAYRSLK